MPRDARQQAQSAQERILEKNERLACQAGLARIQLAPALRGFVLIAQGRGHWHAPDGERLPLQGASVLSCSGEAALTLSLETAAELLVICLRSQQPVGTLHERLFPAPALIRPATEAGAERLRGLFSLLSAAGTDAGSRATECLLEACVWGVCEASRAAPLGARPDAAILRALAVLQENLSRPLKVPELARRVGLSRAAFTRRFSAALGLPPDKYATWLRLRRAAQLLTTTDMSLAGIAAEISYSSEFAFSRAFRRCYGVPPGSYRQGGVGGAPLILALAA